VLRGDGAGRHRCDQEASKALIRRGPEHRPRHRDQEIALTAKGDVAWIARGCAVNAEGTSCIGDDPDTAPPNEFQVWVHGHKHVTNAQRLLGHGSAIAPGSIALTSALVRWTDAGTPMQAPIP
jgi:hypothetical protein